MENFIGVTSHLRKKIEAAGGDPMRETLNLVYTRDGKPYYTEESGKVWRVMPFVEGTLCLEKATPELFEASARAFGRFQGLLADYPAETLHETIVKFHDTEDRFAKFLAALEADKMGRAKEVQKEVQFVMDRKADCSVAVGALREGKLPLKVTHNDTKLSNILIDETTMEGICVIDLDTTMPGLSIYDFGDSIRFGANHCAEDEKDLSKVNFDIELYKIYARGFLEGAQGGLTDAELEYLPWGAKLMTLECGIRFLTDYLDGDNYFRIHYPEQNLDRCRTQFKLVADMENQWDAMHAIIRELAK
jgi:Ser/Thr protein kinase RdoA (MazF antagonist)